MDQQRLERIDSTVQRLDEGFAVLRHDVDVLKVDVAELKVDVAELKDDVGDLKQGQDELRRHMLVLHEEVLDRIKALAPDLEPLRREMHEGFADLRRTMNDRLVPLEAYVRQQQAREA
jgi:chromosome segregation ATPase